MKRDMDLVRKILFYIEENYRAGLGIINVKIDGYNNNVIYEHCKLIFQAGLIQSFDECSTMSSCEFMVGNLSNAGYDYLDKIRENTIWNKTKEIIKKKGLPMIIDTIKTISTAVISAATEGAVSAFLKNGGQP